MAAILDKKSHFFPASFFSHNHLLNFNQKSHTAREKYPFFCFKYTFSLSKFLPKYLGPELCAIINCHGILQKICAEFPQNSSVTTSRILLPYIM